MRRADPFREIANGQPVDCWMLVKEAGDEAEWFENERQVIRALEDGAHNVFTLAERVGRDPNLLPLKRLEQEQVIGRISLTPTDVLHALGRLASWNTAAAVEGAKIQSRRMQAPFEEFLGLVLKQIQADLSLAVLQSLINREGASLNLADDAGSQIFLKRFLAGNPQGGFGVELKLDYGIVAIGAPVAAYIPPISERFRAQLEIPEHAEVANAIGAAAGQVIENVRVLIKPGEQGGFLVHTPWERKSFLCLEEAEHYALETARKEAVSSALQAGAVDPEVVVKQDKVVSRAFGTSDEMYVETRIQVTAVGRPRWGN